MYHSKDTAIWRETVVETTNFGMKALQSTTVSPWTSMDNMVVVWIRVSVWLVVPYDVSVLSCGNTTQSLQVPIISPTGGNLRILSRISTACNRK